MRERKHSSTATAASALVWLATFAMPAVANDVPWLSVTPPFAGPHERVTLTVHGPAGYRMAVGSSYANYGAGQRRGQLLLLGTDWRTAPVRTLGSLDSNGTWTTSLSTDGIQTGELFLQAAVWPVGSTNVTVTNGAELLVTTAFQNGLVVADLNLAKLYDCAAPSTVRGFEFNVTLLSESPLREATLTVPTPTPTSYRLVPLVPEPDLWMVSSGYRQAFGFFYSDNSGESDLGRFPDGTYTVTAIRADGGVATTSASLGGSFPTVPLITSPACGAIGVGRAPTIVFTGDVAARYEVAVEFPDFGGGGTSVWTYRGRFATPTLPASFLAPSAVYGVLVRATTSPGSGPHKSVVTSTQFTTGL
jgi:hypothetical protein